MSFFNLWSSGIVSWQRKSWLIQALCGELLEPPTNSLVNQFRSGSFSLSHPQRLFIALSWDPQSLNHPARPASSLWLTENICPLFSVSKTLGDLLCSNRCDRRKFFWIHGYLNMSLSCLHFPLMIWPHTEFCSSVGNPLLSEFWRHSSFVPGFRCGCWCAQCFSFPYKLFESSLHCKCHEIPQGYALV